MEGKLRPSAPPGCQVFLVPFVLNLTRAAFWRSPQDVLLRTRLRLPGARAYAPPVDMVWGAARGTARSLRQRVAEFYSLPVDKIEIAKYFPDKFEWLPVSNWVRSGASLAGGGWGAASLRLFTGRGLRESLESLCSLSKMLAFPTEPANDQEEKEEKAR